MNFKKTDYFKLKLNQMNSNSNELKRFIALNSNEF